MTAKHEVKILSDFTIEIPLGTDISGNTQEIAPPKTHKSFYKSGDVHRFSTKKEAMEFCRRTPTNTVYLGTIKR